MKTTVFFPQALLDLLADARRVDLDGEQLVIEGGYTYKVFEAVRVLREVTTGDDPAELCGRVKLRNQLTDELGAELLGSSMLIEDSAYDVVPGFIAEPVDEAPPGAKPEVTLLSTLADFEE
jgi:hypothetical protein